MRRGGEPQWLRLLHHRLLLLLLAASSALPLHSSASSEEHSVTELCRGDKTKQRTGYVSMKDHEGVGEHLFYWMADRQGSPAQHGASSPWVLWLGGGCSALSQVLRANGPCVLHKDWQMAANPFSW